MVSFDSPIWRNISADAKDLIRRLLIKYVKIFYYYYSMIRLKWFTTYLRDPSIRLSADQAMMHRWMMGRISSSIPIVFQSSRFIPRSSWQMYSQNFTDSQYDQTSTNWTPGCSNAVTRLPLLCESNDGDDSAICSSPVVHTVCRTERCQSPCLKEGLLIYHLSIISDVVLFIDGQPSMEHDWCSPYVSESTRSTAVSWDFINRFNPARFASAC